jgi:hypothetical protein
LTVVFIKTLLAMNRHFAVEIHAAMAIALPIEDG